MRTRPGKLGFIDFSNAVDGHLRNLHLNLSPREVKIANQGRNADDMRARHMAALAAEAPLPPYEMDKYTNPGQFLANAQSYDASRVKSLLEPILNAHTDLKTHPVLNRLGAWERREDK